MLDIAFAKPALPKSGALVLLIHEGAKPSGLWAQIDEATGGAIARAFEVAEFKGGKGKSCSILAPGADLTRVLAVGLGKPAETTRKVLEEAGGAILTNLSRETTVAVGDGSLSAQQAAEVAFGAVLRSYRFDRYRTKEKPEDKPKLSKLTVLTAEVPKAKAAWEPLDATAKGVFLARDLVSEPANVLDPPELAERCRKLSELGLKVEVLGPKEMGKLGFGALLGVSQGSVKEPRMVVLHWNGASGTARKLKDKPVVFVGKGVTFDTGGISIKGAAGMEDMKWDMAGAGTVIGLMAALAGRKAKVDAIGLVGLVENMPSGSAQRPGDVVTSYSGQTIEVINTDAEGRLVLADVIWYAQQKYDPKIIVDLATLTGAIIVGLGHEYAGMFSNDDALSQKLTAAGQATGERVWRMPLDEAYDKLIRSDIADMKNVGGRPGGSITAAHFIQRFVNNKPWAHLDIAGMAWATKGAPITPKGATAFGVRLLDRLVADNYEGWMEIGFYHLTRSTLAEALPQLLTRTLASGQRALVLGPEPALDSLSAALWAQPAWLPHGTAADGDPDLQPIWLSRDPEPVNGARFLFLVEGAQTDRPGAFERVFDLFDGNNSDSVAAARNRWKSAKAAGHTLVYWQQTNTGWQKRG